MGSTEPNWRGGPKKPAGGRATSARKKEGHGNGYKHKCHHLEGLCREKEMLLARLESEAVYLKQKGAVLELLLEVASEVAVHKRQHTGTKFPELKDASLLEFLERFLVDYGGYAAERPTTHNFFHLERIDVGEFKDMSKDEFLSKYNFLVQRLSLLLLQATDDSIKDGLTSTINNLKQLLLGTLLWNPLTLMEVGGHNLESGEPIMPDAKQSEDCISGIGLSPEQEGVLVIIGDLYNTQVAALEANHSSLSHTLDAEMAAGDGSGVAATIMLASSNMHRLLAIHQLFHVAIMHNLVNQQLAHLCVRCFPRFPCMQDLLNALARVRVQKSRRGLDVPDAPAHSKSSKDHPVSTNLAGHHHSGAPAAAAAAATEHKALQKPSFIEPAVLRQGRLGEGCSRLLQSRSGLLSSSTGAAASGRDEGSKSMWGGDAEQQQQQQLQQLGMSAACDLADAVKSPNKDWDTQELRSAAGTPTKLEQGAAAGQGTNQKRPRSPAAGGSGYSNGNRSKKALSAAAASALAGFGGPGGTAAAAAAAANNRDRPQQQQAGRGRGSEEGDANFAAMAAAAAAGIPVDPAAAAALPVPLDHLLASQQLPGGSSAASPAQLVQQLTALLSAADGPAGILQLLSTQPELAALLQQQPQLLAALQESMAQQQQHNAEQAAWQQQRQASFPDLPQANGGQPGGSAAAQDRAYADDSGHAQARQWQTLGQQAGVASVSAAAAAQGRPSGVQPLEMLPPSVAASKVTGSSPVQGLLQSVATLLQACTSVSDAATAAIESGHSEFVASAVSAAEAALATALKSLQEQRAHCNNNSSSGAGNASAATAAAAAGPPAPGPQSKQGLPAAGPSNSSKLQLPVGIPVPHGPQHTSQAMLPLSLALSGLVQQQAPEAAAYPHSHAMLLAGLGMDQRAAAAAAVAAASEGLSQQQLQGTWPGTNGRQQAYQRQGGSGRSTSPASQEQQQAALHHHHHQQQQQLTVAAALQQLSGVGNNPNPASLEQLLQTLQQPQQLAPEVAAALTQLVCAAASGQQASAAAAESPCGLAALLQQLQPQQAYGQGMKPVPSSGALGAAQQATNAAAAPAGYGMGAQRPGQALSAAAAAMYDAAAAADCYGPASAGYPAAHMAAFGQRVASQYAAAAQATAAEAAMFAASQAAVASAPAGAPAGKAVVDATGQVKEDSPSAGSSSTALGQSTHQPGEPPAGVAAAAAAAAATAGLQQLPAAAGGLGAGDLQQQLDILARAAAGGMGGTGAGQGQMQAPGQAETIMSSVMQLMRGHLGPDGSNGGLGSVANILQNMAAARGHMGDMGQQQHPQLTPPALSASLAAGLSAAPTAAMLQSWGPSAAAAAATDIPPAAAAAMAAGQAAAAAAAEARAQGPQATEFAEMEVDAVSALEMLAAAAVTTQQEEGPSHRRGRTRDA